MDTSRDVFYFADGALAYAGHHYHDEPNPVHSHSFVEIAFVVAGQATHVSLAGRQPLSAGDAVLLRPGVWHGYDDCDHLHLVNCCFSGELLRRELAWTRQDLLLGYLLWTGPYSARGRGMLSTRLDFEAFEECKVHLAALDALRNQPWPSTAATSSAGSRCCSATSAGRWSTPTSRSWARRARRGPWVRPTRPSAGPCGCSRTG